MKDICDWLNQYEIKNTHGELVQYGSVETLLKNRRYIGEYLLYFQRNSYYCSPASSTGYKRSWQRTRMPQLATKLTTIIR